MGRRDSANAVDFLAGACQRINLLFARLRPLVAPIERKAAFRELTHEIAVIGRVEEDVLYPALSTLLSIEELDELLVERDTVQLLLHDLGEDLDSTLFEGKLQVLREEVRHLFEQQRNMLLAKEISSAVDPLALGQQMIERRAELLGEGQEMEPVLIEDSPYYRAHYTVRFNA